MSEAARREAQVIDLLIMLLNDQTGKEHEYREVDEEKDKTA